MNIYIVRISLLLVLLGIVLAAATDAQASHTGDNRPVWHSTALAEEIVRESVQPFGFIQCHPYGARRGTRHRKFDCLGVDSQVVCTFSIRFTTKALRYGRVDCSA